MERLTNKHEADQQRRNYEKRLEQGYPRNIPEERFLRLAAYEDTGLEPEEIVELALKAAALETIEAMYEGLGRPEHLRSLVEAEKDGRLVVLHRKYRGRDGERALQKANLAANVTNNGVNRYTVDAIAEKLAREKAEAALEGASE